MDARGNKEGVNAQFRPPHEQLAFGLNFEGEKDIDGLFADPMPVVTEALRKYDTREEVLNNLPDFAG